MFAIMEKDELILKALTIATANGLFPEIICAICEQESSWNPWAIRYEPAFYKHYIEPLCERGEVKSPTEATARAISWGLMQTMGQVVRELGFSGRMASLCDPEIGIIWGCKVLLLKLKHSGGDIRKALLFYNGGGNPHYPDEVLAKAEKYKESTAT